MTRSADPARLVFVSIENPEHDRCVDLFRRPDARFGFEEFRRDAEDAGRWTPVGSFAGAAYASAEEAYAAAEHVVPWFAEVLAADPSLRKRPI